MSSDSTPSGVSSASGNQTKPISTWLGSYATNGQFNLLRSAAIRFRIPIDQLMIIRDWKRRSVPAIQYRQLLIVAMRDHWRALGAPEQPSFPSIAAMMGTTNHSSVITAYKTAKKKMERMHFSFRPR